MNPLEYDDEEYRKQELDQDLRGIYGDDWEKHKERLMKQELETSKDLERKSVWDLDVVINETHRVCFDEEVTLREAMDMYMDGVFEDVIDVTNSDLESVISGGS